MGKIVLDATTTTLEVVCSVATSLDWHVSYADYDATGTTFDQDAVDGQITTTSPTTVVAAPTGTVRRLVDHLALWNVGAATSVVTVQIDRSATNRVIYRVTLEPSTGAVFDAGGGWTKHAGGVTNVYTGTARALQKIGTAPEASGHWYSFAKDAGIPGAWAPGTPGLAGRATDGTAAADGGCLPVANAGAGQGNHLDQVWLISTATGALHLADIVWVNSGLVVTTTTAQTVNSVAFPARDLNGSANGAGYAIGLLVTTATTNAGAITSMTVSYTNQDGTAGRTATVLGSFPATAVIGTVVWFALQAGDSGVRSIQTITLATSLVTGAVSAFVARLHAEVPIALANAGASSLPPAQVQAPQGGSRLRDGVCLLPLWRATGTGAVTISGGAMIGTRPV